MEPEFPFGALEPGENPGKREHTSHHLTKVEVKKEGGTDNTVGSTLGKKGISRGKGTFCYWKSVELKEKE